MSSAQNEPDQSQQATESLRLCQLELAQVRIEQEPLLEELARERAERRTTDMQFEKLARVVNDLLVAPPGTSFAARLRRLVLRYRRARSPEWQDAVLIEASDLFSLTWYLHSYPGVAASGLPPALHYLRVGAAEGLDPGPDFSTQRYERQHPDLAPGVNPLVHHLRHRRGGGTGPRPR